MCNCEFAAVVGRVSKGNEGSIVGGSIVERILVEFGSFAEVDSVLGDNLVESSMVVLDNILVEGRVRSLVDSIVVRSLAVDKVEEGSCAGTDSTLVQILVESSFVESHRNNRVVSIVVVGRVVG